MRKASSIALAALVALLGAKSAEATTPYMGDHLRRQALVPADGASEVPPDTRIWLELHGGYLETCEPFSGQRLEAVQAIEELLRQLVLEDGQGQAIAAAVQVYRTPLTLEQEAQSAAVVDWRWLVELTPASVLAPLTQHVLRAPFAAAAGPEVACTLESAAALASFTTGESLAVPSAAPSLSATELSFHSEDPSYSDVFQFLQVTFALEVQPAAGEPPAAYNLYRQAAPGQPVELLHAWIPGAAEDGKDQLVLGRFCSWQTDIMWHEAMDLVVPLGEASYFLRAVNHAGQESADSQVVTVTLSCEQTSPEQPDAGTNMPYLDGAVEQDAAEQEAVPQSSGGSCSLTAVGGQGADLPLTLLLVLGALLLRRRSWRR